MRYATDNFSGPSGAALLWGLKRFDQMFPHIIVGVEPGWHFRSQFEAVPWSEATASSSQHLHGDAGQIQRALQRRDPEPPPHVVLLSQEDSLRLGNLGGFLDISDVLGRFEDFVPENYYFIPDTCTSNSLDHSYPQPTVMTGRRFGLPFELSISGFLANASLAEISGVRLPDSENSWTWDDWTEWDARMTDPETGTFGTWARDDYAGQYMPQLYTNGLKKPLTTV